MPRPGDSGLLQCRHIPRAFAETDRRDSSSNCTGRHNDYLVALLAEIADLVAEFGNGGTFDRTLGIGDRCRADLGNDPHQISGE